MLGYNVEALAQDEGYNKGDRLKSVSCTCPNNKSGFSLKCRADGNLEQCTPTRQGSNACYKVKFSTKPLDLICEGSGIKRDANCSARITFFCRLLPNAIMKYYGSENLNKCYTELQSKN